MAYVAISGEFRDRVRSKIGSMHRAELSTLGDQPTPSLTGEEPFLAQAIWGEHLHLRDQVPDKWCRALEDINIKFAIPEVFNMSGEPLYYCANVKFSKRLKVTPNFSYHQDIVVPNTETAFAELVDYAKKRHEIDERWKGVGRKIMVFLDSCKSANEAVKLWPDVKIYFDKRDVDRLEAKTARAGTSESSAASVLAGIDTNEVLTAAVIARMSGAQV